MIGVPNLDRYLHRESVVHHSDARTKIIATLALIVVVSLMPFGAFLALAVCWALVMAAAVASRVSPLRVVRASFVALPFVFAAVPLIFTRDGHILGTTPVGPWSLDVSGEGLIDVATIVFKSWISVQAAALLVFTTPFPDVLEGFVRLRAPRLMVAIISLMHRYLFVIIDEAQRMLRARTARSARGPAGGGISTVAQMRIVGAMVGSLFLRSYERSERVYAAMQARGYTGAWSAPALPWPRRERAALAVLAALLLALTLGGHLWLPILE